MSNCNLCSLSKYRINIVIPSVPDLNYWNRLMLVGEAPGAEEDRVGIPFVGKAGDVLNFCLEQAGFSRDETYITNILKCRPPNNDISNSASLEALKICPYKHLSSEITKIILDSGISNFLVVGLGSTAIRFFTGETVVLKAKGKIKNVRFPYERVDSACSINFMGTLHPAAILRGGYDKEELIGDLKKAKGFLYD